MLGELRLGNGRHRPWYEQEDLDYSTTALKSYGTSCGTPFVRGNGEFSNFLKDLLLSLAWYDTGAIRFGRV